MVDYKRRGAPGALGYGFLAWSAGFGVGVFVDLTLGPFLVLFVVY
jgi:hypothetical protein